MTPDEWEEEFSKYKRSPEYRTVNQGMGMDDFKFIYYLEYAPPPLFRPSSFGARREWVGRRLGSCGWLEAERPVESGWSVWEAMKGEPLCERLLAKLTQQFSPGHITLPQRSISLAVFE